MEIQKVVPNLSIIFPYYNESAGINRTLEFISNQTYLPAEVIFVNSSSTDQTSSLIDQWINANKKHPTNFRNIFKQTNNPASSKNAGIKAATHEWLGFMDCGLKFPLDWVEKQWLFLSSDPTIKFLSGVGYFTGKGIVDRCAIAHTYGYKRKRPIMPSSFIHKSLYNKVGLYLENRRAGYDAEWPLAARAHGVERHINESMTINYMGTNFGKDLPFIFKKSILYNAPTVGMTYYKVPYYYFWISLVGIFASLIYPPLLLLGAFFYIILRGYLMAFKKSKGLDIVIENPSSILILPLAAFVIDLGRIIGIYKGIWHYHLAKSKPLKIKELS